MSYGKIGAALVDACIDASGAIIDEVTGADASQSFFHAFTVGDVLAHGDIGSEGAGEKVKFLWHHGEVLPQLLAIDTVNVAAFDSDDALLWVIKAQQKGSDGGFSGAGGSDDGDFFAMACLQADVVQNRCVGVVSEADVVEFEGKGGGCVRAMG